MDINRRSFLKYVGLTGLTTTAGVSLLPACRSEIVSKNGSDVKDWQTDAEWRQVKYGPWNGPGVPSGPGPMDDVLLKDYAPRSTVVSKETFVPEARYPVIDVHIHNYPAREEGGSTGEHLSRWVKTMDEVGVETSVVLTGATGEE